MVGDAPCYEAAAVCNVVLIETSILQQNPAVEQHCKFGQRLQMKVLLEITSGNSFRVNHFMILNVVWIAYVSTKGWVTSIHKTIK